MQEPIYKTVRLSWWQRLLSGDWSTKTRQVRDHDAEIIRAVESQLQRFIDARREGKRAHSDAVIEGLQRDAGETWQVVAPFGRPGVYTPAPPRPPARRTVPEVWPRPPEPPSAIVEMGPRMTLPSIEPDPVSPSPDLPASTTAEKGKP